MGLIRLNSQKRVGVSDDVHERAERIIADWISRGVIVASEEQLQDLQDMISLAIQNERMNAMMPFSVSIIGGQE